MTILGKYRRRKAREQQLKYFSRTRTRFVRSTTLTPKHRLASNINHNHRRNTNQRWSSPSPRMKKQLVVQEHLSAAADENTHPMNKTQTNKDRNDRMKKRIDTIPLQAETGRILQREVEYFLQSNTDKHCTVLELAEALKINDPCLESLTKKKNRPATPFSTMCQKLQLLVPSFCSTKKDDEDTMKLRYRWNNGLDGLVKRPTSRDTVLSSWAEAKHYLEDIFVFQTPSCPQDYRMSNATANAVVISTSTNRNVLPTTMTREQQVGGCDAASATLQQQLETAASPSLVRKNHVQDYEKEIELAQHKINTMSFTANRTSEQWKRIAAYFPSREDEQQQQYQPQQQVRGDVIEQIEKADLCFNARLHTQEALAQAFRDDSIARTKLREQMAEQERAAEAAERATSFLRDFDDDEQDIIHAAIWGDGPSTSIVAESGMDTVQRSSMRTLQPGMWLNDEIVHYFYLMLAKRDAELCSTTNTDPETTTTEKLRSHFFKSFFITKLLNEGSATNDGEYEYRNVKRWSKKVPGKDIFALDKILFPINMGNMHWISAVIFMQKKRIEIFDSMGSNGRRYLEALFQYLQDEHLDKKKTPLPDMEEWELVPTKHDTPRQRNGYDCGVFTCFFADFLSMDLPLTFDQSHIDQIRERVALSIMKGKAIV